MSNELSSIIKPTDNTRLYIAVAGGVCVIITITVVLLYFFVFSKNNNSSSSSQPPPSSSSQPPPSSSSQPPPSSSQPSVIPSKSQCVNINTLLPIPTSTANVIFDEYKFLNSQLNLTRPIIKVVFAQVGLPQLGRDVTEDFCKLLNQGIADNFSMNNMFGDPAPGVSKQLYIWYG